MRPINIYIHISNESYGKLSDVCNLLFYRPSRTNIACLVTSSQKYLLPDYPGLYEQLRRTTSLTPLTQVRPLLPISSVKVSTLLPKGCDFHQSFHYICPHFSFPTPSKSGTYNMAENVLVIMININKNPYPDRMRFY